ncbi:hypothetical protein, partial [Myxococcus sp. AB036A]|uniref:hypothetical protein n=1 Tax=Myxococcus sp. AB036A TaxID=2562793 RepID=UPI001E3536E6
ADTRAPGSGMLRASGGCLHRRAALACVRGDSRALSSLARRLGPLRGDEREPRRAPWAADRDFRCV